MVINQFLLCDVETIEVKKQKRRKIMNYITSKRKFNFSKRKFRDIVFSK